MNDLIESRLDDIEEEWDTPLGERVAKVAIVGALTFLANILIESAYDYARNRKTEDTQD